jgi:Fe(II)/alpha-ketoglutarate-dependent arginine beta-hydroxylase
VIRAEAALAAVELAGRERAAMAGLVGELCQEYGRADQPAFLRAAAGLGSRLPAGLRDRLTELRYLERAGALWIKGGPAGEAACPTPGHWRDRGRDATLAQDFWLVLVGAQLGDPFAWSSLQDGSLLNDVLPVPGSEYVQTGQGSVAPLELHVEDAFDDDRCDYLGLIALRNRDMAATTVAAVRADRLAPEHREVLREPRFVIRADPEHAAGARDGTPAARRCAVLFGAADDPYLRVDPAFTEPLPDDQAAAAAFGALCDQLAAATVPVPLAAGDVLFIDNYRMVHGRTPFRPRYDGTDRWLRKVTVARDLRRSRARRCGADGRVLSL